MRSWWCRQHVTRGGFQLCRLSRRVVELIVGQVSNSPCPLAPVMNSVYLSVLGLNSTHEQTHSPIIILLYLDIELSLGATAPGYRLLCHLEEQSGIILHLDTNHVDRVRFLCAVISIGRLKVLMTISKVHDASETIILIKLALSCPCLCTLALSVWALPSAGCAYFTRIRYHWWMLSVCTIHLRAVEVVYEHAPSVYGWQEWTQSK